jgi:tetratricopeptide (TPR) repeat protein
MEDALKRGFVTRKAIVKVLAIACLLPHLAGSQPARGEETAGQLVREGVALHDKGDYDGAIAKYRDALKLEPGNVHAKYELVLSLYTKKDLAEAEKIVRVAAKEKSDIQAGFWMMLGNIDDDTGRLSAAIADYQEAIRIRPALPLAHFNLGVTYFRNGKLPEARGALEFEASRTPLHPGTQLMLGKTYAAAGFRVPALLAYSRFLFLEPLTTRSQEARDALERLFTSNVKVTSPSHTEISVNPDASKEEGDFSGAEMMMPMAQVASTMDPKDAPSGTLLPFSDLEPPIQRLASTLDMIVESGKEQRNGGFAADYYLPFLTALYREKKIETFVRAAYSGAELPKNRDWIAKHGTDIEMLRSWAKAFSWPAPSPRLP